MTLLETLSQWVYNWPFSTALRESDDVFPLLETAHVLAVSLIAGSIVIVDLRIIGLVFRNEPLTRIVEVFLPWTWRGFVLMLLTGLPLFAAEASDLYANPAFRLKLLLLALAGLNAWLFHQTTYHKIKRSGAPGMPPAARLFASASLLLWSGIIVAGRLIAVFHAH